MSLRPAAGPLWTPPAPAAAEALASDRVGLTAPVRRLGRRLALGAGLLLAPALCGAWGMGEARAEPPDAELRSLIPDAAVSDPEAWARQQAAKAQNPVQAPVQLPASPAPGVDNGGAAASPSTTGAVPAATSGLSPTSPLADWPAMALPWPEGQPELPDLSAATPPATTAPAEPAGIVAQEAPNASAPAPASPAQAAAAPAPGAEIDIAVSAMNRDLTGLAEASGQPTGELVAGPESSFASGRLVLAWPAEPKAGAGSGISPADRKAIESRYWGDAQLRALAGKGPYGAGETAVHANADRDRLVALLRLYGYYDGEVIPTLGAAANAVPGQPTPAPAGAPGQPLVRFDIVPGHRYRYGTIMLGHLDETGAQAPALRSSFGLQPGDPLDNDKLLVEAAHLATALGEAGYPFAKLGEPALTVDHAREEADLALPVTPDGRYAFGSVTSLSPRFLSSHHLTEIARFHPGDIYSPARVDDLRRAVLATGLVSNATLTPRAVRPPAEGKPGEVAIDVGMTPAPLHTISAAIGYDTGEGFRLETSWEHRNLFPPEGSLRVRGILGTSEQLAGVTFRRNNFTGRDRALTVDVYADNATLSAYAARKLAFAASYARQTTTLFQKPWTWSLGLEAEASEEREGLSSGITTGRILYITTALPLRGLFDRTDSLLDPSHGYRSALRVSPEMSIARGLTSRYVRIQYDGSAYLPLTKGVVLAARVRLGSIPGTDLENIAPSRRFYAGGGGSIRGFGYQLVGPRNANGDPEGGRSLYEFSLEARVKTGLFGGNLQLVPFVDAGGAETSALPHFSDVRRGAGLGFRYLSSLGPIRLDIGTPLDPRPGESRVGVYVALGQSF